MHTQLAKGSNSLPLNILGLLDFIQGLFLQSFDSTGGNHLESIVASHNFYSHVESKRSLTWANCWRGNSLPPWPAFFPHSLSFFPKWTHQSSSVHDKSKEVMWSDKTVDRKVERVKDRINEVLEIVHNSYVLISLLRTKRLLSKSSHSLYTHLSFLHRNR